MNGRKPPLHRAETHNLTNSKYLGTIREKKLPLSAKGVPYHLKRTLGEGRGEERRENQLWSSSCQFIQTILDCGDSEAEEGEMRSRQLGLDRSQLKEHIQAQENQNPQSAQKQWATVQMLPNSWLVHSRPLQKPQEWTMPRNLLMKDII